MFLSTMFLALRLPDLNRERPSCGRFRRRNPMQVVMIDAIHFRGLGAAPDGIAPGPGGVGIDGIGLSADGAPCPAGCGDSGNVCAGAAGSTGLLRENGNA
jgi:hypothetical protein